MRFIGGLLLIIGTSIGGGMLALPVVNAASGFYISVVFLILCWLLMTLGAFYILEVNLYFPSGSNLPSMAYATLGRWGLVVTWVCYLLLMYVLLCAYIAGGSDVLANVCAAIKIHLNDTTSILLFTLIFGAVVYAGIYQVDLLNRILMLLKLLAYGLLVGLIAPSVQLIHLKNMQMQAISASLMILITAFGFAIIVPNLRTYFADDLAQLKKVIWLGSLVPLICYIAWDAVIIGSITNQASLANLLSDPHTTSSLSKLLASNLQHPMIIILFNFFTSICMLTAFLGVALCLMSFLSDGLKVSNQWRDKVLLSLLTFGPPLSLVLFYPQIYLQALHYAGYLCVILLLFLPALMALNGRKRYHAVFTVWGGKYCLWLLIIGAIIILGSVGNCQQTLGTSKIKINKEHELMTRV